MIAALAVNNLAVQLQPIFELGDRERVGFEALGRVEANPSVPISSWLAAMRHIGAHEQAELELIQIALGVVADLPEDLYLSINVSPDVAVLDSFWRMLMAAPLERVIIELTEHVAVSNYEELKYRLAFLRGAGARLAVDDVGAGYSSLQHVLQLAPDIIKLDRSIVQDIDLDEGRQFLCSSLVSFADNVGISVLAEGIETESELQTILGIGIRFDQGFLLGIPVSPSVLFEEVSIP